MSARVRNILSIDGCGFRGRAQIRILGELMKRLQQEYPQSYSTVPRPSQVFDLIGGTAVGGLFAILLGRLEMTCDEALTTYQNLETALFGGLPMSANPGENIAALVDPSTQLDTTRFQTLLRDTINTRVTGSNQSHNLRHQPPDGCRTLVTVMRKDTVHDTDALRVRSYAPPQRPGRPPDVDTGSNWTLFEAAVGTTRCPRTIKPFEVEQVEGNNLYQAANASGFSNPGVITYSEAMDLFPGDDIVIISLGMGLRPLNESTTTTPSGLMGEIIQQLGGTVGNVTPNSSNGQAAQRLRDFITQSQLVATATEVKHARLMEQTSRIRSHSYHRLNPERNATSPFIFLDFFQVPQVDQAVSELIRGDIFRDTWRSLQRRKSKPWYWRMVPYRPIGGTPNIVASGTRDNSRRIDPSVVSDSALRLMQDAYTWEGGTVSQGRYISCFTSRGQLIVGPVNLEPATNLRTYVYVRVLVDDDSWVFHSMQGVANSRSAGDTGDADDDANGHIIEDVLDRELLSTVHGQDELFLSPVEAVIAARNASVGGQVRAFSLRPTGEAFYTTETVSSEIIIPDTIRFPLPCYGVWQRK